MTWALAAATTDLVTSPTFDLVEGTVRAGVQWLRLGVELVGASIVAIGVAIGLWRFASSMLTGRPFDFTAIRLTLARYLALALEFQLGADILSTAIAPSFTQIGQLGAIAVIRTLLNYFLSKEMQDERETSRAERDVVTRADHATDPGATPPASVPVARPTP